MSLLIHWCNSRNWWFHRLLQKVNWGTADFISNHLDSFTISITFSYKFHLKLPENWKLLRDFSKRNFRYWMIIIVRAAFAEFQNLKVWSLNACGYLQDIEISQYQITWFINEWSKNLLKMWFFIEKIDLSLVRVWLIIVDRAPQQYCSWWPLQR